MLKTHPAYSKLVELGKEQQKNIHLGTNVVELYSRLEKDGKQLTYYTSGIGTYVKPSWTSLSYWIQLIDHSIDMAIAWYVLVSWLSSQITSYFLNLIRNFKRIVLSAYQWLSENYEPGDRIFLFGELSPSFNIESQPFNTIRALSRCIPSSCCRWHDREGRTIACGEPPTSTFRVQNVHKRR